MCLGSLITLRDEEHLLAAARYVELNPVRADLCEHRDDWFCSSAPTP
jgi:putative transposase